MVAWHSQPKACKTDTWTRGIIFLEMTGSRKLTIRLKLSGLDYKKKLKKHS